MNIWQFQNRLSQRLFQWGLISSLLGFLMMRGSKFWQNIGWQFIGWGLIDALIALFGQHAARQRLDSYQNPGLPEVKVKEAANLRKLLWFNALLDVFYVLGGRRFAAEDKGDGGKLGTGVGIMLQGAFLLLFDVYHALMMPDEEA